MRRILLILLIVPFLLACGTEKAFHWSRFDSNVVIEPNGTLQVTETIGLKFDSGSFTFAYRDIDKRYLEGISNVSLSENDQAYQLTNDDESKQPLTFAIINDDDMTRIRWVYPETTSGNERVFTLRYTVAGAVRQYPDGSQIWWAFVPAKREAQVDSSENTITGIANAPFKASAIVGESQTTLNGTNMPSITAKTNAPTVQINGTNALVNEQNIPADKELSVVVQYPAGVLNGAKPAWQVVLDAQNAYNVSTRPRVNMLLSAIAAGLAVLLGALWWSWMRRTKDPAPLGAITHETLAAPSTLTPAEAGKLLGQYDGRLFLGTLFDLAQRGHLRILEQPKSRWGTADMHLERLRSDDRLQPFEAELLNNLFQGQTATVLKTGDGRSIKLASTLGKQVDARLFEQGLLDHASIQRRNKGSIIGVVLMIVGFVGFVPGAILAQRVSVWLPILGAVVFIMGMIWLFGALSRRGVTQTGATERAQWQAFQSGLRKIRQPNEQQFAYLLPFAAALADATKLTKIYSDDDSTLLPMWFVPNMENGHAMAAGSGGESFMLHDFSQNFLSMMSSTSVGAGASSGGGGGASGGGGAGAG